MRFIIDKETLLNNLQKVLGPTTTKQNFPILSSVLISSTQNGLKFTTTDLDITIISIQENEIQESGQIAVPMKRFLSIVRELPNQPISIQTTRNKVMVEIKGSEYIETPIANKKWLVDDEFLKVLIQEANKKLKRTREKIKILTGINF